MSKSVLAKDSCHSQQKKRSDFPLQQAACSVRHQEHTQPPTIGEFQLSTLTIPNCGVCYWCEQQSKKLGFTWVYFTLKMLSTVIRYFLPWACHEHVHANVFFGARPLPGLEQNRFAELLEFRSAGSASGVCSCLVVMLRSTLELWIFSEIDNDKSSIACFHQPTLNPLYFHDVSKKRKTLNQKWLCFMMFWNSPSQNSGANRLMVLAWMSCSKCWTQSSVRRRKNRCDKCSFHKNSCRRCRIFFLCT